MSVYSLVKFRVPFLRIPVSCHIQHRSAAMPKYKGIPDRWGDYIPIGKRIPGTRFIAFKVPLSNKYDGHLTTRQRFSPIDLVKGIKKQNEKLGLVVDLTCTTRYYSSQDLPQTIQYNKIFTIGHQVPDNKVIRQFKSIVTQYLHANSKNDKLVGVHCTHGLNRTGYLICRYLIDVEHMEPSEAIEKFNSSRGHSIERNNYLQDLLHGDPRSNPELNEPQANHRQQTANSRPPPHPEKQPWSHGHTSNAPRLPGPPIAQPSRHHRPGEMMGPQHGFHHPGGKFPSRGPRIPPPGYPLPRLPGPRYMEDNPPQHFSHTSNAPRLPGPPIAQPSRPHRPGEMMGPQHGFHHPGGKFPRAPNGPKHRPPRPFPPGRGYGTMNGAPRQDCRPPFPHQSDDHPGNCYPAQPSHSLQHGSHPYQRFPDSGHKKKRKKPKQ